MASDPYFYFFASDWLGSTRIAMMEAVHERGLLRLLCHLWGTPDCALPDNDDLLARLSLMHERWFDSWNPVKDCLSAHPVRAGYITEDKLLALKMERADWREKSRLAGIKSGESRRSKRTKCEPNDQPNHEPNTQPKANIPSPSPIPSLNTKTNEPPLSPPGGTRPRKFATSAEFEEWYAAYPKRKKPEAAEKEWRKAVERVMGKRGCTKGEAIASLLEAAHEFAKSPAGKAGRFCPHPSTWLSQGQYDDDRSTWYENEAPQNAKAPIALPRL